MNSNWEKVEKLYSGEETIVEKGGGDSSKEKKIYRMSWLKDLFVNCTADVLDPDSVSFFVKKAQKLQLESLVVKENIQQKSLDNQDKKQENRMGKNETLTEDLRNSEHCNASDDTTKQRKEGSKEVENYLNDTTENLEAVVSREAKHTVVETDAQNKTDQNLADACVSEIAQKVDNATYEVKSSILPSDLSQGKSFKTDTQKKIGENMAVNVDVSEAAATVKEGKYEGESSISDTKSDFPKCYANGTNIDLKESDSSVVKANAKKDISNINDTDSNKITSLITKSEEIKALDKDLDVFESKRVSAPSPFTAYMNIKYLIDNIVKKQDTKLAQRLQENCDCQWNNSQQ